MSFESDEVEQLRTRVERLCIEAEDCCQVSLSLSHAETLWTVDDFTPITFKVY